MNLPGYQLNSGLHFLVVLKFLKVIGKAKNQEIRKNEKSKIVQSWQDFLIRHLEIKFKDD
jgi:hypothetical protein|tara:strand:+ start:1038 stop:1217 length:180 start_codon:yes stop_codon:yes gene_type:complete